jgi:toxic protein SymE
MAKRTIPPEPRSAQEKFPYTRQLKVRKGYYDYHFNNPNPHIPRQVPKPVPWVILKGYWLHRAGFTIGTSINIKVSRGSMVLRAIRGSVTS